jgi:medium-chain acyl-[acyl-carrier-protein] hydrolase
VSVPRAIATLLRVSTAPPRRRLFCIPFAGGGAGAFRWWGSRLPAEIELAVLQLPGRDSRLREAPLDRVEDIVAAALPAVTSASDLPYAIFGHSMGALVAYELTLALEASSVRPPDRLFVSARRSPEEEDDQPPVHHLPDDQFLDELQRRYDAVPAALRQEPELLALLLPALRADLRAIERYQPTTTRKVECPVHVYGGADDRHPRPSQLPRWQRVAEREIRVRMFAGGHFYFSTQLDALTADIVSHWSGVVAEAVS